MAAFWERLPEWLRPSTSGLILFVVLIALQACIVSGSGMGQEVPGGSWTQTASWSMGWPASVVITSTTTADGPPRYRVQIRWATLLPMGGVTYGVAMAIGNRVAGKRRRGYSSRVLLAVIGGTLGLAFLAAIVVSKGLWGYYLSRPSLDRRIAWARKVVSVTLVETTSGREGPSLIPDTRSSIWQRIAYGRHDDYYNLGERALIALEEAHRLPISPPPMSPDRLARLYGVLERTGRLEAGEPGYDHAKDLRGVVIEADGSDGKPLLFVGVQGGEVSNDHHPYYEFLFSGPDRAGDWNLLSAQRFYFDIAGSEGMEWPVVFIGFSALGLVVSVPMTLLAMAVWPRRAVRDSIN
jgi:hypothetical protein